MDDNANGNASVNRFCDQRLKMEPILYVCQFYMRKNDLKDRQNCEFRFSREIFNRRTLDFGASEQIKRSFRD